MFHSLRVRLIMLVFLAVAPSLALIYYNADEQRRIEIERAKKESSLHARLLTGKADQLVEGARLLLVALAQVTSEHSADPAYVDHYLRNVLKKF